MVVIMSSRPCRRDESGYLQFRKRLPSDIAKAANGKRVAFTFPSGDGYPDVVAMATLRDHVKFSLRTRDPEIAKQRHGLATAQLQRICEGIRNGPRSLTHKQRLALAGLVYRDFIADYEDEPGNADKWELLQRHVADTAENGPAALERCYGHIVDAVLVRECLVTDEGSRKLLIEEAALAISQAARRLKQCASGDYRPDQTAERFPVLESREDTAPSASHAAPKPSTRNKKKAASSSLVPITFDALFEKWRLEVQPAASTVASWQPYLRLLKEYVGHDDPRRVTKADMVSWKDALIAAGRSPRGTRDGALAAVRAVFNYAVANDIMETNPVVGVTVKGLKKRAGTTRLPYADEDVSRIIALSDKETHPTRHWLPLLMATSGARVAELTQLWGQRVVEEDGMWLMKIAPAEDGGSLKNEGSERAVPIHPAVIERGFLEFVKSKGNGPLFYGRKQPTIRRKFPVKTAQPKSVHASKGAANHIGEWIRSQGFNDPRKAPNHAFRHWWKTAAQRAGVLDSVADAIQGHTGSRGEADGYRHASVKVLFEAVSKVNVPREREHFAKLRVSDPREHAA